ARVSPDGRSWGTWSASQARHSARKRSSAGVNVRSIGPETLPARRSGQPRRVLVVLAPPHDPPVAQLAGAHPPPGHGLTVGAPLDGERPVGEDDVAVDREVMHEERPGRSPAERGSDHLLVVGATPDGPARGLEDQVVDPAVEV